MDAEMTRIRTALITTSLLMFGASPYVAATDDDHLRPDPAYISRPSEYVRKLSEVFDESYQDDSVIQVLFTGSFSTEQVVSIRRDGGKDQVIVMEPKRAISGYQQMENYEAVQRGETRGFAIPERHYQMLRKELPGTYREVPIETLSKSIPSVLTDRVATVWRIALLDTRHGEESGIYLDGGFFTFSMRLPSYGVISGSVFAPSPNTNMNRLVNLAGALSQYAKGSNTLAEVESALAQCEQGFEKRESHASL